MKKIVIPIEKSKGEDSIIFHHFGRSPLFAIVEVSDNTSRNIKFVENTGEHFGGRRRAVASILNHNPDALIVKGMGPGAFQILQDNGIAVFTTESKTVSARY